MIKINVITSNPNWYDFIKNPTDYVDKKIKKLNIKEKNFSKNIIFCTLLLSGNKEIKYLNKKFRKKNKSTDVLSFPFQTKKEFKKLLKKNKEIYIGDIIVNLNKIKNKKCLFEFIYFMSADSIYKQVETFNIRQLRYQFGIELGKGDKIDKTKVDDKIVIGAPQTGIPSGRGFADYLGINYEQILVKNKNAGRSFILKNDEDRLGEIKKKFIIENGSRLENKELYFVDDSLVRGNTLKIIIEMLKEYKPKKIHIRIASPKVINICEYGIDIPSREELIMNHYSNEKYVDLVGVDSIKFLELEAFYHLFGNNDFCTNCFSNETLDW